MDLVRLINVQTKQPGQPVRRTRTVDDLGEHIGPEVRAFVQPLRTLFAETGLTFREFASSRPFSLTSISRYLSGERVPTDQHFRDEVLDMWVLQNNVPEEVATRIADRLVELHREALRVTNAGGYRKLTASERLAAAVHEREVEKKRVRRLERQLEEHTRQMALTQGRLREIESQVGRVEELEGKALELAADRARLLEEIARLAQELEQARQAQAEAEERCRELEAELENADNDLERERLVREAQEQRRLSAEAERMADHRMRDLESAEEQAEQTRETARSEAERLRAEVSDEASKSG